MQIRRHWLLAGAACLSGFAAATGAAAQGAAAGQPTLEEVVVTAQRREERLQDVPVSVTAVTGQMLASQQVTDLTALQRMTPSLNVANFPGDNLTAVIAIRGLGSTDALPTIDPAVGTYLDGVYIARASGGNLGLYDIDRVEVLRGPQGTLFGRNTIGGAINIVTTKPKQAFEGSVETSYGNYDAWRLRGVLNLPVNEKVAVRLVGSHSQRDGFAKSTLTGAELNPDNTEYLRGQVAVQFNDDWDLLVSGDWTNVEFSGGQWTFPRAVFGTSSTLIRLVSAGAESGVNYTDIGRPDRLAAQVTGGYDGDIWGVAGALTGRLNDSVTTKLIVGYRDMDRLVTGNDLDGTRYTILDQIDLLDTQHQVSVEYQLYGKAFDNRLDWIVGAYYFQEEGRNFSHSRALFPLNTTISVTEGLAENDSKSLFAQATYSLTEQLRLTGGIRWVRDTRELVGRNRTLTSAGAFLACGVAGATPPLCTVTPPKAKFTYEPFTVGLDYKPNADVLLYGKFSRGFRAGGFNLRGASTAALTPFDPESVDSYEIGAKTELLNRRLRLNVAAYHSTYKDMQLSSIISSPTAGVTATITNAGRARINGFEAEAMAVLGKLTLSAAVGYIDGKFKELAPTVTTISLDSPIPLIAKWTANLAADYKIPTDFGSVVLHGDYSYKDNQVFASIPPSHPANAQGGYSLFNATVTANIGERLWMQVWGANLTDKKYILRTLDLSSIGAVTGYPGDPRTYGVRVGYRF